MTLAAVLVALVTAAATPRVEVVCEPGLEGTAEKLARVADNSFAELAGDLAGLPVPDHVRVQVVRDASSLAAVAPAGRGAPSYAIGVAYPDLGVVTVALRRGSEVVEAASTLEHEVAHLALGAAIAHAPHWLHEGFAHQHEHELSFSRLETLAGMAWFGGIIAIDDLDRSFPQDESPAQRAYAESYDFVGFLARRGYTEDGADEGDRAPFRRFLGELARGATLDAAATKAYGKPLHALFDEWKRDLTKRYLFAPLGVLGLAVWVLCAVLLFFAWRRRRRQNRARIAQWEREEADIIAPPYVPWPGEDPLAHEPDEHERDPRSIN